LRRNNKSNTGLSPPPLLSVYVAPSPSSPLSVYVYEKCVLVCVTKWLRRQPLAEPSVSDTTKKRDQGLISPTCLCTALCTQIPKSQNKYNQVVSLFTLSGSALVKAANKMLMKLTTGVKGLTFGFYKQRFQNRKNFLPKRHWWLDCLFALLGSTGEKQLIKHWWNIGIYFILVLSRNKLSENEIKSTPGVTFANI